MTVQLAGARDGDGDGRGGGAEPEVVSGGATRG